MTGSTKEESEPEEKESIEQQTKNVDIAETHPANESDENEDEAESWIRFKFKWTTDNLIALLSYNINLQCLWNLPYLAIKYGGAAFLIPYVIFTVVCGYPLYYMELGLGQYSSRSVIASWSCAPLFRGIGYAAVVITFFISIYQAVILAWSFFYFGISISGFLPWKECSKKITKACSMVPPNCTKEITESTSYCINGTLLYSYGYTVSMNSSNRLIFPVSWKLPAEEYFHHNVLEISSSINESGSPTWELVLCLIAVWGLVAFCLIGGAASAAKLSYASLVLPFLISFAIFVQAIIAPGSALGLLAFLNPDWTKMEDVKLWGEAALLAFFTLFPNWGTVLTINSFSKD